MFCIRIADVPIGIDNRYPFIYRQCKGYITDSDEPEFTVRVSEEEILEDTAVSRGPVKELIRLTLRFTELFAEKKRKKNLLESSDLSVKEIGFECGFYDPSYFSRIYRRHFGVTPGNYRRKAGTERQNAGLDLHQGIHYNKFSKKKKEENL